MIAAARSEHSEQWRGDEDLVPPIVGQLMQQYAKATAAERKDLREQLERHGWCENAGTWKPTWAPCADIATTAPEFVLDGLHLEKATWQKVGFGLIARLRFTIENRNAVGARDIQVRCEFLGKSGSVINSNSATIYDRILPRSRKTFDEIGLGFIGEQVRSGRCWIVAAEPISHTELGQIHAAERAADKRRQAEAAEAERRDAEQWEALQRRCEAPLFERRFADYAVGGPCHDYGGQLRARQRSH